MNKLLSIAAAALLVLAGAGARAQSVGPSTLNAAGGSATVGSNTYEYSIGEMTVVSTNTAGSVTATHGVLQPFKQATSIAAAPWLSAGLAVYPNPATDAVSIAPALPAGSLLSYSLMDITGKVILSVKDRVLHSGRERQEINIASLAAANYMLVVEATQPNGQRGTDAFKINKVAN